MRLYQSSKGQWVGTKREAQKQFPKDWREVEVPTSKKELMDWLSLHEVGAKKNNLVSDPKEIPSRTKKLDQETYSWVVWAYETLKRGDKVEAEKMLHKGLCLNKELSNG